MGEWEEAKPQPVGWQREVGKCWWWGCEAPGPLDNPYMAQSAFYLARLPLPTLCGVHHAAAVEEIATAARVCKTMFERLAVGKPMFKQESGWERAPVRKPLVARVMRERRIREAAELKVRDEFRAEWIHKR